MRSDQLGKASEVIMRQKRNEIETATVLMRFHGWNSRVWTRQDFDSACVTEGIVVSERDTDEWDSSFVVYQGTPIITLRSDIYRGARLAVAIHALAHYYQLKLQRLPKSHNGEFYCGLLYKTADQMIAEDLHEVVAHAAAACAVLPRPVIDQKTRERIRIEHDYCGPLLDFRYLALQHFDI